MNNPTTGELEQRIDEYLTMKRHDAIAILTDCRAALTVERERGTAYERQLMSKPTGEWTADTVYHLLMSQDDDHLAHQIAKSHNAALAAERDAGYEECRELWQQDVQQLRDQLAAAVEAIAWLNEFVVEPEYFPAEGDRYWWQEKRAALAKIGEK